MATKLKDIVLNNGVRMPAVGLGTWKSPIGKAGEAVKIALENGYKHIDCAHIYGNEAEIGQMAFGPIFSSGAVKRSDVFITSKLWCTDHRAERVREAVVTTLKNLQLEYLDLYLVHWPISVKPGLAFPYRDETGELLTEEVSAKETWQAMEKLVDEGLVRSIGVSNFSTKKLQEILSFARIKPAVNQVETHPYMQQRGLLDFCNKHGIHITAYSPLGSPDRPRQGVADPVLLEDPVVKEVAAELGRSTGQVLIRWAAQRGTSVIPKTITAERIVSNFDVDSFELSESQMKRINDLERGFRYIDGSIFFKKGQSQADFWDGFPNGE